MQQGQTVASVALAGFGERLVAYIIDGLIIGVPLMIVGLMLPQPVSFLLNVVVGVTYVVYFWTSSGSTPGKSIMGLKVVSAETGERLDTGTAVLRYVGYIVSSIPFALGFLWVIWDERRQGWHDKIAKTCVVRTR